MNLAPKEIKRRDLYGDLDRKVPTLFLSKFPIISNTITTSDFLAVFAIRYESSVQRVH